MTVTGSGDYEELSILAWRLGCWGRQWRCREWLDRTTEQYSIQPNHMVRVEFTSPEETRRKWGLNRIAQRIWKDL